MKQYIVDAFTDKVFSGNPAAVCVMDSWLPDETMQKIAIENNLSETAFIVKKEDCYGLRWFTPGAEVDLCGHATLASAFVMLNFYDKDSQQVAFDTLSGRLYVTRKDDMYEMSFPSYDLQPVPVTDQMTQAIGAKPISAYMGRDLLCIMEKEEQVTDCIPDMDVVNSLDGLLLHITAQGSNADCVSRSFAPKLKIVEDPVCGSGHCHIAPYWLEKLGKQEIVAYQASRRGGTLYCSVVKERTIICGKAALFSIGEIFVD